MSEAAVTGLIGPVLLIAVIAGAVALLRQRGGVGGDGEGSLRRVFLYGLAFVGLMVAASGLAGLLRVAFEGLGDAPLVSDDDRGLALGLTLTVVGTPVWALAWRAAQARRSDDHSERHSTGRRLYLGLVRAVSLSVWLPSAVALGWWALGTGETSARPAAWALVWGSVWVGHEYLAREVRFGDEGTGWPDRLAVYVIAAVLLSVVATALGLLLESALDAIYRAVAGATVVVAADVAWEALASSGVVVAVTGAVWWWYWIRVADGDAGARTWRVYVFLVGIVSGTITVLVAAGVLVHTILSWFLGASADPATTHFDDVPASVAAAVIGAIVWGHHRARLFERDDAPRTEGWSQAERIYRYLLAGLLVVTAAGGLSVLLAVGVDAAIPGRTLVEVGGGLRRALSLGLTMLLIGAPGWWWAWSSVRRTIRERPAERSELPRRVLIFAVFGVAIVTAISAGGALLYQLLSASLEGELDRAVLEEQRWAIGLLLSAGVVSGFHWSVLKEDRRLTPAVPAAEVRVREVVLVAADGEGLAADLRSQLDAKVTSWSRSDVPAGSGPPASAHVVAAVRSAAASRVLVLVGHDGSVETVPLTD